MANIPTGELAGFVSDELAPPVRPVPGPAAGLARRLIFHVFGVLAEFERDLIRERTKPVWLLHGHVAGTGGRPTV